MTDVTADEAVEAILGVPLAPLDDTRPATAEPCWEEKHSPAVSDYDPDRDGVEDPLPVLLDIRDRLQRLETAINQVGSQTNWLVQAFAAAQAGWMEMSKQLAEAGPMGLIKMISGKGKKGGTDNG